ncbi:MAG TPA: ABC transporter substrate-binding protein [Burkholderiales bacterium]|nr:ABC transporter substrate-binding protein [Burkholderiales bacterium]
MYRLLTIVLVWLLSSVTPAAAENCPRIISQSPYITHSLEWLGLKDCIVGVSRYDTLDRPRTGGVTDPDKAAIAALKPDLMLTTDWTSEKTWTDATPPGARAIRLYGFRSMREVEDNLHTIAEAAGRPDAGARAKMFATQWRKTAKAVKGNNRRVLLLSACRGSPYTFGTDTWLHDLFTEAGFIDVETHSRLRHLKAENPVAAVDDLVGKLKPDVVFVFERANADQCAAILPRADVRIVALEGEKFLHPAPVLLDGLEALIAHRGQWHKTP